MWRPLSSRLTCGRAPLDGLIKGRREGSGTCSSYGDSVLCTAFARVSAKVTFLITLPGQTASVVFLLFILENNLPSSVFVGWGDKGG